MPGQLCFVLMPFGRKPDAGGTIIDFDAVYQDVIAPAWTVTEDEHLLPSIAPQIDQLIARAAQKTRQIKISGLKHRCAAYPAVPVLFT